MPSEEELLTRQMPHSTEAEQSVLGSMLIDAAACRGDQRPSGRRTSICAPTGRSMRPSTPCSTSPSPSTGDGAGAHEAERGCMTRIPPQLRPPAHGDHPHGGQREGVRGHRQGQGPAAAHRRDGGELTAMVQEGTGTAQRCWRPPSSASPSARPVRLQGLAHISSVILNVYELNRAGRQRLHRSLSTGLPDVDRPSRA